LPGEILLQTGEVSERSLVLTSPKLEPLPHVNELSVNPKHLVALTDRSHQDPIDTQATTNGARVAAAAFMLKHGASRDHTNALSDGELTDDPLGKAIEQVVALIAAHGIVEGQHGNRPS